MDHGPSALFTIQLVPYIFLAQNCKDKSMALFETALRLSRLKFEAG